MVSIPCTSNILVVSLLAVNPLFRFFDEGATTSVNEHSLTRCNILVAEAMRLLLAFAGIVGLYVQPSPSHPVGFTVINIDPGGSRALVWRPVVAAGPVMTVSQLAQAACPDRPAVVDCFPDLAGPTGLPDNARLSSAELAAVARERLQASPGGTPVGRLPLIVLTGAIASRGGEFAVLAETLANRAGVVVAVITASTRATPPKFTPAETAEAYEVLSRAIEALSRDSGVDATRVAIGAWSFGGVPAALTAMNSLRVRALVSLDSAIRYQYGVELIRSSPDYRPAAFSGRVLSLVAGVANPVPTDEGVLRAMTNARVETQVVTGLRHGDFSDQYLLLPLRGRPATDTASFPVRREDMVRRILTFINSAL